MRFEDLPKSVRESVPIQFEETVETTENLKCPKCNKGSVIRRVYKELQQPLSGCWFIEYCTEDECKHWDCGFK